MATLDERTAECLLESAHRLSDDELVSSLKSLVARERRETAVLVAHLAELDTRDVHLREGYPSLFEYCRIVLALSESEAYNRIEAARTARRYPVVLDLLTAGDVNLTTVRLLGPHLTAENHRAVLASARGQRKAVVEEIVARLSPRPDVAASLRRVPEPRSAASRLAPSATPATVPPAGATLGAVSAGARGDGRSAAAPLPDATAPTRVPAADPEAAPAGPPVPRRAAQVTPLSPDRYRYQLTIGGSTVEKLRLAKDMLRHVLPSGDDEVVLDRALDALLAALARQKFGGERNAEASSEAAPTTASPADDSRNVPVAVKRAVWVRDLGRCAFVGATGRRCDTRAFLEFHHLRPYAVGGPPTVGNIQLRCRRHNDHERRVFFAREAMVGLGSVPDDRHVALAEPGGRASGRSSAARSFRNEAHERAAGALRD